MSGLAVQMMFHVVVLLMLEAPHLLNRVSKISGLITQKMLNDPENIPKHNFGDSYHDSVLQVLKQ